MDQLPSLPSSPTVTKKTVLFGQVRKYLIRAAPMLLMRLSQRFADFGQVGFLAWWRVDGQPLDAAGLALA